MALRIFFNRVGFHRVRAGLPCWIHLGRRIASNPESLHSRPTRVEGNLDQHASGLLSARADDLLGAAQIRRLTAIAISHPNRVDARGIGGVALAGSSTTQSRWRMAGRRALGLASRDGAISRVGD